MTTGDMARALATISGAKSVGGCGKWIVSDMGKLFFNRWYYTAHPGTVIYGWACFRLAIKTWRFLIFHSYKYGEKDVELCRIGFFESLHPSSILDDFIRNNHLILQ